MTLDLAGRLSPAATLPPSASVEEALALAQEEGDGLLLVVEDDRPQALLAPGDLAAHGGEPGRTLADLLPGAHELVVLDEEALEPREVRELVGVLLRTGAPGVVVLREDGVAGVLPAVSLAEALPLGEIASGRRRMYGDPTVPTRTFVCRTCEPPTRRRPRTGFEEPLCPRNLEHGPMERDEG